MDAVELARQAAAGLHAQAVAKGLDPWDPYAFAKAEAERRGIDVERTAPGALVLAGSRATYVAEDRLIIHENAGTPFEQAFLVAHEVGHAELGDDPAEAGPADMDPTRPAEASPVGIDRVVGYGRRQRREVQMDLFAREFLLPRPVVRRLHVEEGLAASAIADRLGAPFDVVAQQLLDALLLPAIPAKSDAPPPIERPPNALQDAAARHRGDAYLLEAGPGTGKTQTLTGRVEGLLADGVDPRRILVLTFSNKAAGEMAERIGAGRPEAAAAMWIGTFHAFGLDLIRRFHAELGLPQAPRLMDRTEAVELLEHEFPRLGLVHYRDLYDPTEVIAGTLAAISRAKDEAADEARYEELATAMLHRATSPEERVAAERALEVARVYRTYEEIKRRAGCIDFGDLVSLPVRLLEGDPAIRSHLQGQYDHVLVDEYQDVNRGSVRLLAALRGEGENLWAVGDAKQAIYRFRGASSFNVARFGAEDFPGGARGRLRLNYRSVPEVVGAFSTFAAGMKAGGAESGLEPVRSPAGHQPELRTVMQADQQAAAMADAIEEMRGQGFGYRDQAVLCTGNEKLSRLGQELESLGIPVLFLGSLFERPEVRDLLAFLSLLVDRRATGLLRVACWPEFRTQLGDVAAVIDHLRAEDDVPPLRWVADLGKIDVSAAGRTALEAVAGALRGFDGTASPWTVLAVLLLDRTRMAARLGASAHVADRARGIAIWQLMNFVRVQPTGAGLPVTRLLDRIRRLLRLGDDRDLRQLPAAAQGLDAVRLMTIHGAKGLEFPVVHLPGMSADTLPRTPPTPPCLPPDRMVAGGEGGALELFRDGQKEEQECLFYVAVSRARDRLFLYAPTHRTDGANRPPSPFLARLGPGLVRRAVVPRRVLPPASDALDVELSISGGLTFTGAQIKLYESCPRRFFYTHILHAGGRRTATAFMRMHDAVRAVVEAIARGDTATTDAADVEAAVVEALAAQGLAEHGYAAEYEALALAMAKYFVAVRSDHTPAAPAALSLAFGQESIVVRFDDVLLRPDGKRTLRLVRTGHRRSAHVKDVHAAALVLAAGQAFPGAAVELVHLADGTVTPLGPTPKSLSARKGQLAAYLADVRRGRFPATPSPRACPGCPSFFVCGPTPPGTLARKF